MALSCSKKLSALSSFSVLSLSLSLLSVVISKNNGDFYCLNCLHFFRTRKNLNCIKKYVKIIFFCNVIIPSQDTQILEFNQYQKSDKAPLLIMHILNL